MYCWQDVRMCFCQTDEWVCPVNYNRWQLNNCRLDKSSISGLSAHLVLKTLSFCPVRRPPDPVYSGVFLFQNPDCNSNRQRSIKGITIYSWLYLLLICCHDTNIRILFNYDMIVTALSELLIDMNYIFVFHIFMMRYWISRRHKDSESVKIIALFVAIWY